MARQQMVSSSDHFVDDFYFSALTEQEEPEQQNEETFSVSDSKYAEELQFQEALMASTIAYSITINKSSSSSESPMTIQTIPPMTESGGHGEPSLNFCEICVERKENDRMFKIESCVHSFCSDCISKHATRKIRDSFVTVTCPGLNCKSILAIDTCRAILPKRVIELWENALCEKLFDTSQKFYCPYKDCSAMLVNEIEVGEVIINSECPLCHRMFCAQCKVPWHSEIECEEYQKLNEDERGREDLMVRELVKKNKWSRCPRCKFFVERIDGCPHIVCRCKYEFCYGCGSKWSDDHDACESDSDSD